MIIESDLDKIEEFTGAKSVVGPGIYHLFNDERTVLCSFQLIYPQILACHIRADRPSRGKTARKHAKECIEWIFSNTDTIKLQVMIPEYNRKAYYFAISIGFKYEGKLINAWRGNDKLHNLLLAGYCRGDL